MKKQSCEWCELINGKKECDNPTCDFKSLKRSKAAIIERMQQEKASLDELRKKIYGFKFKGLKEAEDAARDIQDKAYGLKFMGDVLHDDFGMSLDEIKKAVDSKAASGPSTEASTKLRAKLTILRASRRGSKSKGD